MGKIKKILENELLGGTTSNDVYPITSTQAVYTSENKKMSDSYVKNASCESNKEDTSLILKSESDVIVNTITIPAATTEYAGVMSAEDKKNIGYSAKNTITYCADRLINSYIKELYISGENAKAQGFYVERIIKNANNTCVCAIYSADKSLMFYIESIKAIPYKYYKATTNGFTLETIINFEKVTEKWDDHVCDAETGKLLPWSYNIDASPCIKAVHLHEESMAGTDDCNDKLVTLGASVSNNNVTAIKGKYLLNNGKVSSDYADGYYSEFYPAMSSNRIRYSGRASGNVAAWAFYDSDKNFLSAYPASNPETPIILENGVVENIPENTRFIRFGSVYRSFSAEILPANLVTLKELDEVVSEKTIRNPLYNKSVDWIGASHMQGIVSGVNTGGFASIIAERNSMTSNNYGIGGTTVAIRPGQNNSFVERIETYSKDVDYLVVMGGANDTASTDITLGTITEGYEAELDKTTFYGAWEWLCKYVMENYSEKKYGFIIPFHIANKKLSGEWGDAIADVCKKWGMPYLDLRVKAGFNIYSVALRKIYGAYVGNVPAYDSTKGYALDEQVKFEGALYKSNTTISAPAGDFDATKWTLQESDNTSDYDNWHCNVLGYKKLADVVEAWLRTL